MWEASRRDWLVRGSVAFVATLVVLAGRSIIEGRPVSFADVATGVAIAGIVAIVPIPRRTDVRFSCFSWSGRVRTHEQRSPASGGLDRLDRFTQEARQSLTYAQDESQGFNHDTIGTEHLLLGLLRVDGGTAGTVLANLGVDPVKVRRAVEFIVGRGPAPVFGEIGLTPRAVAVIELAVDEAGRLGHDYVGTEHLLLGIVAEGEGIAGGVLESLGVDRPRVRAEVQRVLDERARES